MRGKWQIGLSKKYNPHCHRVTWRLMNLTGIGFRFPGSISWSYSRILGDETNERQAFWNCLLSAEKINIRVMGTIQESKRSNSMASSGERSNYLFALLIFFGIFCPEKDDETLVPRICAHALGFGDLSETVAPCILGITSWNLRSWTLLRVAFCLCWIFTTFC